MGAVIVLLSLAMDPFAQQLLSYPVRLAHSDSSSASINAAKNINPLTPNYDNLIQRSVNDAIWNDPRAFTTVSDWKLHFSRTRGYLMVP